MRFPMRRSRGIQFGSPDLEAAVRKVIGKSRRTIIEDDLLGITELKVPDNIRDITGIERCVNLSQ
jgi:hypothetical protein